jgi:hypothetical protein
MKGYNMNINQMTRFGMCCFLGLQITAWHRASAQGTFNNLGFESTIQPLDSMDPTGVPSASAIPGWATYFSGFQVSRMYYNTVSLGGAGITLHDTNSGFFTPLQGSYGVFLQGSGAGPATSAEIGQSGTIPAAAASLRFWQTMM